MMAVSLQECLSRFPKKKTKLVACENIRFSTLFAAGDVSRSFNLILRLRYRSSQLLTHLNECKFWK